MRYASQVSKYEKKQCSIRLCAMYVQQVTEATLQLSLPYMMIVFRNYSHSVSNQREMRSCLFLFTLVLFFTGLSQVEGKSKYQFVNFLKFLKLMKANGWDKKYLDSNNRKIIKNLLLPKKSSKIIHQNQNWNHQNQTRKKRT